MREARTTSPVAAGLDRASGTGQTNLRATVSLRGLAERELRAERAVDALLAAASHGKTFSATELIALQAMVFRYSQTVEVISRATDRLIGSIKQMLGTQV